MEEKVGGFTGYCESVKKSCWWDTSAPTRCNFLQAGSCYGRGIRENDWKVFLVCTEQVSCSVLFSRKRGRKWFIMDNDPSQRSVAARKAIEKECCELVCIPARSLDLNSIENMFHMAKKELERQVIDSQIVRETLQEFKSRVIKTLHNIPVDYVDSIITSMPKRINAVLQRNGYRAKY